MPSTNGARSIVIGALHGRFTELFTKLATLHSKNNFTFALLLGDVFDDPSPASSPDINRLVDGKILIPCPTYFTLGHRELPPKIASRITSNAGEICENLFFLGKKGVLNTAEGIRIVTVGGTLDSNLITSNQNTAGGLLPFYTEKDVTPLRGQNHCDLLISSDWPLGVESGSAAIKKRDGGSGAVADLASRLRPRYHLVPGGENYYEREPYRNDLRSGEDANSRRVTRFYAIADYGNLEKKKSMFAFMLDTSAVSSIGEPTASPYQDQAKKRSREGSETFFWGEHTSSQQHQKRRKQHPVRPPPGPGECFFCLSYPQLEKHLIVSIGGEAYCTTAKGPLTSASTNPANLPFSSHILIIPLSHTPIIPLIEDPDTRTSTLEEMHRYRIAIDSMLRGRDAVAVTFEVRRRRGVHAHWQVVPVPVEKVGVVDKVFEEAVQGKSWEREEVSGDSEDTGDAFRYWVGGAGVMGVGAGTGDSGGSAVEDKAGGVVPDAGLRSGDLARVLRLEDSEYFDLQFGRKVLAQVLGAEKAVFWRDCVLSTEEETKDAGDFKQAFREWDFSLEN
jgi:hypothetical protein